MCRFFVSLLFFFIANFIFSQNLELNRDNKKNLRKKFDTQNKLDNFLLDLKRKDIAKGYILADYDSIFVDTTLKKTVAFYSKGRKFYWGKIQINDSSENAKKYKKFFTENTVFAEDKKNFIFNKISKDFTNFGYPFITVKLDSVEIQNNKINGEINIEKENKIIFDSIIIKGDSKIRPYYIYKTLKIKHKELFSLKKVNNISTIIKNTTFLSEERPFDLAFNESVCDILLYLKKKKASSFSGILGILPNNKTSGKVLITGDVNLYLLNLLNFGELFSLQWQKYESSSQFLDLDFEFPYIFKSNFGIGTKFILEKRDSICLTTDFTGKILYGNSFGSSINVFYRNINSFLLLDTLTVETQNYADNKSNMFGLNYSFSNLNNNYNPQRGISFSLTTSNGLKSYKDPVSDASATTFKNQSQIEIIGFIPVLKYFAFKLRNQTGILYSKILFNNELYLIGGTNSIRGFDEKVFFASNYSFANIEFRYLFDEYSCVFAFFDIGYFEQRFTPTFSSNYVMGIGTGLDLRTVAGIFSLALAIGKQNENPFDMRAYKIHIGYKAYF